MICYRDKTYCIARCSNHDCNSKLTQQVELDAKKWWGNDKAPIAMADFSQTCEDYKAEEVTSWTQNQKS